MITEEKLTEFFRKALKNSWYKNSNLLFEGDYEKLINDFFDNVAKMAKRDGYPELEKAIFDKKRIGFKDKKTQKMIDVFDWISSGIELIIKEEIEKFKEALKKKKKNRKFLKIID